MLTRFIAAITFASLFLTALGADEHHNPTLGRRRTRKLLSHVNLRSVGIRGFLGHNGPAIGSWFRTSSSNDHTNGRSWCGYPYNDNSNGFAPSVQVMLDNFGGNYEAAAKAYCGLEAIVTVPGGRSKKMYIIDGFDPRWVRTPGSIDITKGQFAKLHGSATNDKNIVIKGIRWRFTGRRSAQYAFKGPGR